MNFTQTESPHRVGDIVRIDYGDILREDRMEFNGEMGEIVGHDVHDQELLASTIYPEMPKSMNLVKLIKSGKTIREHWTHVRRLHPLEALARVAD